MKYEQNKQERKSSSRAIFPLSSRPTCPWSPNLFRLPACVAVQSFLSLTISGAGVLKLQHDTAIDEDHLLPTSCSMLETRFQLFFFSRQWMGATVLLQCAVTTITTATTINMKFSRKKPNMNFIVMRGIILYVGKTQRYAPPACLGPSHRATLVQDEPPGVSMRRRRPLPSCATRSGRKDRVRLAVRNFKVLVLGLGSGGNREL
mmetsp:Transcript_77219/g.151233  ORF Transcript_77219/g.151233 Transcript_77219/m.151233 type:complete len:204 (-) Transcript_77219:40-651(-)